MNKDIEVRNEEYFRSKSNKSGAYDMARVTIELPITAWRAMKGKLYGDELISHRRRFSDIAGEEGVECPNCSNGDHILRERTEIDKTGECDVKYKYVFYKCKRCNEEFNTDMLVKENNSRISATMNKNGKK